MKLSRLRNIAFASCLLAILATGSSREVFAQDNNGRKPGAAAGSGSQQSVKPDKAQAYYHYSLGHIYQERGSLFNRPDLLNQAIDEFKQALAYDPTSSYLSLELA